MLVKSESLIREGLTEGAQANAAARHRRASQSDGANVSRDAVSTTPLPLFSGSEEISAMHCNAEGISDNHKGEGAMVRKTRRGNHLNDGVGQ